MLWSHLSGFSVLFVVFIIVAITVGLYYKQSAFVRGRGWSRIIQMQIINGILGVIFFYFAPVVIAPKVNLFIFMGISTLALYVWRVSVFPVVASARKQPAILIGSGDDIDDLMEEINSSGRYGLDFKEKIDPVESEVECDRDRELRQAAGKIRSAVTSKRPTPARCRMLDVPFNESARRCNLLHAVPCIKG